MLVLKVGPQVKLMPDLGIFVGAIMGKIIVLELPEPCKGDLSGFSNNFSNICLHKIVKNGSPGQTNARFGLFCRGNNGENHSPGASRAL